MATQSTAVSPPLRTSGLREFGRRHRALITVGGSVGTAGVIVFLLAGQRDEFETALSSAALWVLAITVLIQIVGLVSRSEAWHITIAAAGGAGARGGVLPGFAHQGPRRRGHNPP